MKFSDDRGARSGLSGLSATAAAELAKAQLLPAVDETQPRALCSSTYALTSGTLALAGAVVLPQGRQLNAITFMSGATALAAGTHQWFCVVRASDLAVLAKTADDLATAWNANAAKQLAISGGPYVSPEDELCYLGCLVTATTPPNLKAVAGDATLNGLAPKLGGNSSSGLTTPASLGANAAAITAQASVPYALIG